MKRYISIVLLSIPLLLVSCDKNDNFGNPYKITFEKEGGTKICTGTDSFYSIEVANYNGDGAEDSEESMDSLKVTYNWLTVKCKKLVGAKLEMTAIPNHTGKKRTLYVRGMVDNDCAEIKVIQH